MSDVLVQKLSRFDTFSANLSEEAISADTRFDKAVQARSESRLKEVQGILLKLSLEGEEQKQQPRPRPGPHEQLISISVGSGAMLPRVLGILAMDTK